MTVTTWPEALDACDRRIAACRQLLDGDLDAATARYLHQLASGEPTTPPGAVLRFEPPSGLGPMPPELAARARSLLDDGAAVAAELGRRRDEVMARLRGLSARQSFPTATHDAPRARMLDRFG